MTEDDLLANLESQNNVWSAVETHSKRMELLTVRMQRAVDLVLGRIERSSKSLGEVETGVLRLMTANVRNTSEEFAEVANLIQADIASAASHQSAVMSALLATLKAQNGGGKTA